MQWSEGRQPERRGPVQALADLGGEARYNQLREHIMALTECSNPRDQPALVAAVARRESSKPAMSTADRHIAQLAIRPMRRS